jgi:ribosome biogenesis GTPase A
MPLIQVADECQHDYQNPKHEGELKYCHPCEAVYCDSCYEAQRIHSKQTERHRTHERTDLEVARFVLRLFNTYVPRIEDRQQQHEDAYPSKWFGVHLETPTKPSLHVFGALATLLKESQLPPFQHYPSLVSFVGDTGAGKSTLINGITKVNVLSTRTHCIDAE